MSDNRIDSAGTRLSSASGLGAVFNSNGSLRRFDHGAISLNLFVGNEIEGGPANLYLRRLSGSIDWIPLLGPESPTRFEHDAAAGTLNGFGVWHDIRYALALVFARDAAAWFWHVTLENTGPAAEALDLTYAQDLALAPYGAVRMNEFYVSQYIDHAPLLHPKQGWVIASRQNQAADGRFPWCVMGSLREASSYATDAIQFYGLTRRLGAPPAGLMHDLPGRRVQHEHSMAVIRDKPLHLSPGATGKAGFFGRFLPHHPEASSAADLAFVDEAMSQPESRFTTAAPRPGAQSVPATLFSASAPLDCEDVGDAEFLALHPGPRRHEEFDEQGRLLSFFCGEDRHVVLRAKELRVLRPHGHMLRTGLHLTPDESALTSTVWMNGVFHSMVTQGHVSINRFLSTVHGYIGLFRSHGLRVFVELDGAWRLLDTPSIFEMSPFDCRWVYRHAGATIDVRAAAASDPHRLTLCVECADGTPRRFLFSSHVALNGDDGSAAGAALWSAADGEVRVRAVADSDVGRRFPEGAFLIAAESGTRFESVGGDEKLFADGRSRDQPFVCIVSTAACRAAIAIRATLVDERSESPVRVSSPDLLIQPLRMEAPGGGADSALARRIAEFTPWSAHNALVHYLSPRGLEQYSGGGWGTRDVCQGPVETLLAMGRVEPLRDLLLRVMRTQNPDGDWPQWFMFFERERNIRPGDSHGDIVFWPVLALAQYLLASGDAGILEERLPFFDARGPEAGDPATLWEHVRRALDVIERRVIPGTTLAAYGHGDWNDSLQPADPSLRERLCSAWTVTLNAQVLATLARALRSIGRAGDAAPLESRAADIRRDFQRLLVVDGVLAGYALFEEGGGIRYLLHPRDQATGVHYSSLAMIHAILEDMLTPDQIRVHLQLINRHLHAPDGIRLFDRPMPYRGGPQRLFQRAETASYFGREIGLMYMHAHLRYAQALAHLGKAQSFFEALCQANPIGIRSIVPTATLRQCNCYYSSSDAAFDDRYQASSEYERVGRGAISLEGGWRVYSSGAGITMGLIMRRFLGFSEESESLLIDPVMPSTLNGLEAGVTLLGRPVNAVYEIGSAGCGVASVVLNGQALNFDREPNVHRPGAARISTQTVRPLLNDRDNRLQIRLN